MDSICGSSLGSRAGPLTPYAPAAVRAAQAAAVTHRHLRPLILDEAFPAYETAMANLPEEPTPVKLLALTAPQHSLEGMDEDIVDPGLDPTEPQTGATPEISPPPTQQGPVTQTTIPENPTPQTRAEGPLPTAQSIQVTRRQEALAAFLQAPGLPSTSSLNMGDIAFMLHLLLDTPDMLAALS